jgi:hypothetical protein
LGGDARLDPFRRCRASRLALGAHLDAFGALRPFDRGHTLHTLHARCSHLPLHARGGHLAFHARRLLAHSLRLLARLSLLTFGARGLPVLLRPRVGRGRDRQCGDARGEKYPGHHNFSFSTASTAMGPHRSLA